ncbi:MAG: relaxase domain-containing protein [Actinobacteria bacterium]|nr:relaxase domain-containing protein [Actinomycetota bacterium]
MCCTCLLDHPERGPVWGSEGLLGRDPATDTELLAGHRARTVMAFDVTFSAPKSVSLLWAFGSPEVASVASIVHVEAVAVALDLLERRAGATRLQVEGERQRIPTGVAAATFVHRTSRDGDPQLHSHCVVANFGRRPDGTYAALDATPLYEWGRAAGSVYQEELRRRLTERLGVEWGPDRHGCREIAGFDPRWLRTFSKRTVAIDDYLAGAGPENPDPKQRMWADEAASLATRPRRDGSLTPEVLRERWQAEADGIGMPTGHALEAEVCGRTIPMLRPGLEWDDLVDALIEPEEGLCARRARFNEAHVVEHIAALGAGRLPVDAIEDLADAFLASEHAVPLADRTGRTSPQYSTADHLLLEERVLDLVADLCATPVDAIPPPLVKRAIAGERPGLGDDQADAVQALCAAGPAIRTVIAPAGFGKTTTVHAAATAAGAAGHPVLGLAATNQAACELRQAGIDATTIARFALDGAALPPGTVVVLDEVSQVATSDAEIVLDAVAATPGATLWCLGDPHQAQAVRAGGLGAELARLGATGHIPAPELTENRRQLDPAEQRALARYRAGLVATSQAIRQDHGWEHDLGSPHATREALADALMADIDRHGAAGLVALAVSHADCEDLADRIRHRLRATGHLHGPELAGPAWNNGERRYAAGDRLLVHGTLRTDGQRLHNGSILTVTAIGADGLQAVDREGHRLALPHEFVEGRRADGSPNCSHAWARTVDGIQGGTWEQVHLLGTAALERFTGYTGQSRSRHATHTWNVTRLPDIDHGGVLADQRTPTREVLDALRRQPDSGFAIHDAPSRLQLLLAERAELRALLQHRPPDRRPALHQAELRLESAKKELYWAHYRLNHARERLDQLGRLSQFRSHGRREKASTLDQIDRFTGDVRKAEAKIDGCERVIEELRPEADQRLKWDVEHRFPDSRLRTVEAELADLGLSPELSQSREASLPRAAPDTPPWLDRLAEVARPPLPGPDMGAGIDIGP